MKTSGTIVACCQLAPQVGDAAANRSQVRAAIHAAAAGGAEVIVLPELCNTGYMFSSFSELTANAETLDGPTITEWRLLAQQLGVIIVGGFAEQGDNGRVYNSAVIVDETGLLGSYRKAHLWDTEKTDRFTAGDGGPLVVDTRVGRLGLVICYDLEFAEWVRIAALAGAALLCSPVNWPLSPRPTGERAGEIFRVQAAASSNRIFIAAADRTGTERGQDWLGGSVIVDPDGFPVTEIRHDEQHIGFATLNLEATKDKAISAGNDVHKDRRPDLYV